ncbi:MAG: 6,7-dimethyl-8-ribityllumazine synthase [Deltaproteobacteria bacterium RIFOXYA12_FULL_58_15]|nr:MAG: 6,7-dimethyl-8-ribityllumazine synthase [Deltaproteobacteria bacterium RIFOXYA12_FULL_58_15]OGR08519.1 MAG: 6,7-dimethyl-8-ribityllumazine synthase [Deltaproteobacteria bacterium RIFOXYB12_FULL_58_9]
MAEKTGQVFSGNLVGDGLKFAVVVSRFNEFITSRLLGGATDAFVRHGVKPEDIDVAWTPGTFEMPLVARRLADSGRYDAICCIGAVIRGGTPHFDFVAGQAARGIATASWESGKPVSFGILTTDTIEQAIERAGTKAGNKGFDAAVVALEMAQLMRALPG